MKKLFPVGVLAALALMAAGPSAADSTNGQDRVNGSRACSALKTSLGATTFGQTYGTNASRSNSFGMCVSRWTSAAHAARHAAMTACRAEQADPNFAAAHGGKTFTQFYGTKGKNAFANCVKTKTAAALTTQRQATQNAAQQCKAERRTLGEAAFKAKYGTNANKSNAFGKCVSTRASQNGQANRTTVYQVSLTALNNSGVSGTARLSLKGNQLTVTITATGLEANKEHMQHIHGFTDAQQNATCPTVAQADSNKDGLISLAEGLPFYGGVLLELKPYSTTPTGTLSFEQTYTIDLSKLQPLENRVIVLHGKTVNGTYDASLPVACGEITR
jgi:hypothetical protein